MVAGYRGHYTALPRTLPWQIGRSWWAKGLGRTSSGRRIWTQRCRRRWTCCIDACQYSCASLRPAFKFHGAGASQVIHVVRVFHCHRPSTPDPNSSRTRRPPCDLRRQIWPPALSGGSALLPPKLLAPLPPLLARRRRLGGGAVAEGPLRRPGEPASGRREKRPSGAGDVAGHALARRWVMQDSHSMRDEGEGLCIFRSSATRHRWPHMKRFVLILMPHTISRSNSTKY
mmetsp:Transcript_177707/g.569691  ORF Transcript_177707/g.569691 Transcript_177707/m.569691 type:complete len:229 (+) Transcript_177707:392-1078(+)